MATRTKSPWVRLVRSVQTPHGPEKAGAVGIRVGPAKVLVDGQLADAPGMWEVHLVHAKGGTARVVQVVENTHVEVDVPYRGGDTRAIIMVRDEDLALVTDRNDVPADRLATYAKDWVPAAAGKSE